MDRIEGRHPVMEAIKAGRPIEKILVAKQVRGRPIDELLTLAEEAGVRVQFVDRELLDRESEQRNHQGVVAIAAPKRFVDLDEIVEIAKGRGEDPFILILDGLEDPHNVGSLLRTAHAAGVHGVVMRERRAVGLTSTVAKVSAGAIEYVEIAQVVNLGQAIEQLKEKGLWIAGADMDGDTIYGTKLTGPLAVVVGAEGKGISRLIREKCDFVVSLPMQGQVASLNASVAGALVLYEVVRQRQSRA